MSSRQAIVEQRFLTFQVEHHAREGEDLRHELAQVVDESQHAAINSAALRAQHAGIDELRRKNRKLVDEVQELRRLLALRHSEKEAAILKNVAKVHHDASHTNDKYLAVQDRLKALSTQLADVKDENRRLRSAGPGQSVIVAALLNAEEQRQEEDVPLHAAEVHEEDQQENEEEEEEEEEEEPEPFEDAAAASPGDVSLGSSREKDRYIGVLQARVVDLQHLVAEQSLNISNADRQVASLNINIQALNNKHADLKSCFYRLQGQLSESQCARHVGFDLARSLMSGFGVKVDRVGSAGNNRARNDDDMQ